MRSQPTSKVVAVSGTVESVSSLPLVSKGKSMTQTPEEKITNSKRRMAAV